MKICDLTQFYSPVGGGVRRYIEQKTAYIRRFRPDCSHVLIVPGEHTATSGDGMVRVHTIASPLLNGTARYRFLSKLHLVEEILEREQPDILESGDPYQVAWKAVASGRGLDFPVVGFYHSHFPEAVLRTVEKFCGPILRSVAEEVIRKYVVTLYNHFERTFVPSPVLAQLLRGWGIENVTSVDLGVDDEVFRPDPDDRALTRDRLGLSRGKRLLLYVGRLGPEKNVHTLFRAFQILHSGSPGVYQLLCLGDGTQRAALENLRDRVDGVHWHPFFSDPHELASVYRCADLFVHPGVQETFGLVALESQACGTPVVGIRGSYMDRIIFSDQSDWAEENSPLALAAAIGRKFHSDPAADGMAVSQMARGRYAWRAVFGRLFGAYEEVIDRYSP